MTSSASPSSKQRLRSYGGELVEATVFAPASVKELRGLLATARDRAWQVTFRGGGCAFDTQSLNHDVVISLGALRGIAVDPEAAMVTAEAGATWGAIVAATMPHGLVPYTLVTTRSATVAGTVASDCLSRFSPTCGKEGEHILSFELLTVDGALLQCSREENREVFFAGIGGLGYLGAILRATYRLLPLGYAPRVETVVTPYRSLRELVVALIPPDAGELRRSGQSVEALYGASLGERGLHFRSRYVEPERRLRPIRLLHEPRSLWRALVDLALRLQLLGRMMSWLTFHLMAGRARTYVDGFEDYAFFMDGNAYAKRIGRRFGAPMRTLQQTFILPVRVRDGAANDDAAFAASIDLAVGFMRELSAELRCEGIAPTLFDCLFIPRDEGFLLSSSAGLDGLALSIAFDTSNEAILARARHLLRRAGRRLRDIGGRVHLVKSVCADPADLAAMYRDGAAAFFALKERLDPTGVLRNQFLERIFPEEAARWRPPKAQEQTRAASSDN